MNFDQIQRLERDDLLQTGYLIGVQLLQYKISKWLMGFTAAIHMSISALQIYLIAFHFDYNSFIKFSPFLMETLFGLQAIVIAFCVSDRIGIYWDDLKKTARKLPTSGQEYNEIQIEAQRIKFFIYVIILLAFVTSLLHLPFFEDGRDIYFAIFWINQSFGGTCSRILSGIYYVSLFPLAAMMVVHPVTYTFFLGQIIFQIKAFNGYLKGVHLNNLDDWKNLYYNSAYQKSLEKRMKFIIIYHVEIKTYFKTGVHNFLNIPIITNTVTGMIMCASVMFVVITNLNWFNVPRIASLAVCLVVGFIFLVTFGQTVIDQSMTFFDNARELPWYVWNKKNKRLLLLLLSNSISPLVPRASNVITIDKRFFLKFLQFIFSLFAFMHHALHK